MTIALNTERMARRGEWLVDGYQVNYLYGLDELCKKYVNENSTVLELGVNDGVSTTLFASYAAKVVAVDKHKPDQLTDLLSVTKNIEFHHMTFADFYQQNHDTYDLIYIDGSHHYNDVKADILECKQRVKPGGVLSGHDFNSYTPDVKQAVTEIFDMSQIEVFSDSSWAVKIPEA